MCLFLWTYFLHKRACQITEFTLLMGPDTHFGKIRLNFNKRLNFTIFDIYVKESVMSWIYDQGNVSLNPFLLFVPVFLFLFLFLFYFFSLFIVFSSIYCTGQRFCFAIQYVDLSEHCLSFLDLRVSSCMNICFLFPHICYFSLWGPYVPHCSSFHNDDQN